MVKALFESVLWPLLALLVFTAFNCMMTVMVLPASRETGVSCAERLQEDRDSVVSVCCRPFLDRISGRH